MTVGYLPPRPSADQVAGAVLVAILFLAVLSVLLAAWYIAGAVGAAGVARLFVAVGIILLSLLLVA